SGGVYDCTLNKTCVISGTSGGVESDQRYIGTGTNVNSATKQGTIDPELYMPNWASAENPTAYLATANFVNGVGIEGFSVQYTTVNGIFNITFYDAENSWMRNVRSIEPATKHVLLFYSHHITVRDSYMFASTPPCDADAYGVDIYYAAHNLVENNIFQRFEVPMMNETNAEGNVFGYNYSINNLFDTNCVATSFMQASGHDHGPGTNWALWEGNDGDGAVREDYFGTSNFDTDFRNRWSGWESTNTVDQTSGALITANARFHS